MTTEGRSLTYNVAVDVIYKNGFVGLNAAGFLEMYAPSTSNATLDGNRLIGMSLEHVDNSAGTAGDLTCEVLVEGTIEDALASSIQADIGAPVFVSDDNTLSAVGFGNDQIGWIEAWNTAGRAVVRMHPLGIPGGQARISRVSALLDLTTASDVVMLIHPTENHNGLIIEAAYCYLTVATSTTAPVITLQDTAATPVTTGITLTGNTADAIGDIIQGLLTAHEASTGEAIVFVPANLGCTAIVTTASATGAGRMVVTQCRSPNGMGLTDKGVS
jgi:hypothetical protein